jgi:Uma2 family endonuclease
LLRAGEHEQQNGECVETMTLALTGLTIFRTSAALWADDDLSLQRCRVYPMAMPLFNVPTTADELDDLPSDGNRYEIIDGVLLVTPAPSLRHQWALTRLLTRLLPYVESIGLALFVAPTDVRASATTQVEPDLFVLPRQREIARARNWVAMTQLRLAVEVLSPATRRVDRGRKRTLYMSQGVAEYWIVDVDARAIEVSVPGEPIARVVHESFTWRPLTDRPPLIIDLEAYFREIDD